jgi:hypothetical protein
VSWKNGYDKFTATPNKFPIDEIWFNDKHNLQASLNRAKNPENGWMDKILNDFGKAEVRKSATIPGLNEKWVDTNGVARVAGTGEKKQNFPHLKIIGPNVDQLKELLKKGGVTAKPPPLWKVTAQAYEKVKTKGPKFPSSIKNYAKVDAP